MPARNWVEISRGALGRNLAYVRSCLEPETAVCAVVKADAYGHGAGACAAVFAAGGVEWLAVTSPEEGARLRASTNGAVRILVLAGFDRGDVDALLEYHLTPAVWDAGQIAWLAEGLAGRPEAAPFPLHLKLETGMGRLGVTTAQEAGVLAALGREPRLRVEAVFTHMAASEAPQDAGNHAQRQAFQAAAARWAERLAAPAPLQAHLLNGEGALRYPCWGGCLARVGLALYGYSAQPRHAARLEPALSWKTRVLAVKDLPAGHGVGYGAAFRAPAPIRVAILAVGYADGYRRQFWPGARVLIGGRPAPVVGNISMDLTAVDVTGLPAPALGDEAVLLGGGNGAATAADLAALAGTIPYEILCGLSARVERLYF